MATGTSSEQETFWIIGAGRFGMIALERLSRNHPDARFVMVDPDEHRFFPIEHPRCRFENTDGVGFLIARLSPDTAPDWIIPALPLHLAAEWCLGKLRGEGCRTDLDAGLDAMLPHPVRGASGEVYVSLADFLCPDDCPEPKKICTVTRKPRKPDMFGLLEKIRFQDFDAAVVRSRQLGPGVGGIRPDRLFGLLSRLRQHRGRFLVATACRCHGVLTGISVSRGAV